MAYEVLNVSTIQDKLVVLVEFDYGRIKSMAFDGNMSMTDILRRLDEINLSLNTTTTKE